MISGAWFAIRVPAQKEFRVEHILLGAGRIVYLPCGKRWKRINHIDRRRREIPWPLYPGYLFVDCDNPQFEELHWHEIPYRVVGSDGVPRAVSAKALEAVKNLKDKKTGEPITMSDEWVRATQRALREERLGIARVPREYAWGPQIKRGDRVYNAALYREVQVQELSHRRSWAVVHLFGAERRAELTIQK